jgi:hypothetical protein
VLDGGLEEGEIHHDRRGTGTGTPALFHVVYDRGGFELAEPEITQGSPERTERMPLRLRCVGRADMLFVVGEHVVDGDTQFLIGQIVAVEIRLRLPRPSLGFLLGREYL